MFRRLTSILLLIAIAAQSFNQAVIVIDYYTHTSSFAQQCENKAIPMMHCKGKCQMMKKLQEEEKKEQQYPQRRLDNINQVISSRSFYAYPTNSQPILRKVPSYPFQCGSLPRAAITDIFHPPASV